MCVWGGGRVENKKEGRGEGEKRLVGGWAGGVFAYDTRGGVFDGAEMRRKGTSALLFLLHSPVISRHGCGGNYLHDGVRLCVFECVRVCLRKLMRSEKMRDGGEERRKG